MNLTGSYQVLKSPRIWSPYFFLHSSFWRSIWNYVVALVMMKWCLGCIVHMNAANKLMLLMHLCCWCDKNGTKTAFALSDPRQILSAGQQKTTMQSHVLGLTQVKSFHSVSQCSNIQSHVLRLTQGKSYHQVNKWTNMQSYVLRLTLFKTFHRVIKWTNMKSYVFRLTQCKTFDRVNNNVVIRAPSAPG